MMHAAAFLLTTISLGQAQTDSLQSGPATVHKSGQSYSQLASYMSCSDWSPRLWNNYPSDRAATAACISKHVDMRCNCFENKQGLHSQHAGLGGADYSESCKPSNRNRMTNRYRKPMSTRYTAASNSCNVPCTGVSGCESSIPYIQGVDTARPDTAELLSIPSIASPPRDRVATPLTNHLKSEISILNTQPGFEVRR